MLDVQKIPLDGTTPASLLFLRDGSFVSESVGWYRQEYIQCTISMFGPEDHWCTFKALLNLRYISWSFPSTRYILEVKYTN